MRLKLGVILTAANGAGYLLGGTMLQSYQSGWGQLAGGLNSQIARQQAQIQLGIVFFAICALIGLLIIILETSAGQTVAIKTKNNIAWNAAWLLPFSLGFLGAVIIYFITKQEDIQRAKRLLIGGLIIGLFVVIFKPFGSALR